MIRGSLFSAFMLALTMTLIGGACSDDTEPPPDLGGHDLGRDGARDGITKPDGQGDGITKPDGKTDGPQFDLPPKEDAGPPLPDKGVKLDGCGQCTLSIYRINGSTTLPTQLSSLDDKDAAKAGIQINVDVSADCTADGTVVTLNVTGSTTPVTATVSGGYAVFTGVTVFDTVGVVTLNPTGTTCTGTPRSINVVRDPTCTFLAPAEGQTLTSKDDTIPNNGVFNYTVRFATQYATGGTVTATIVSGASMGSAPVSAATGQATFANQELPSNGAVKIKGSVEIMLAGGQKLTKDCLVNTKNELDFTVNTTAPNCSIAGFTPAAITTPNGPGLGPSQDKDSGAAGLQTTVTVNTDPGVDVTLTYAGKTETKNSGTNTSVAFDITLADGAPNFSAKCVNTTTLNQSQSGNTKVIVDTSAPLAVTDFACFVDLSVSNHRKGILTCDWTSADDGTNGSGVASYDVNCDKNAVLTVSGFDGAPIKSAGKLPTPTPKQTTEISGVSIPNSYSCAVQAVDALGNRSAVSNITALVPFEFQVQEIQGTLPNGRFGTPIVAGDFNCDGLTDVAVGLQSANGNLGEVQVFFSSGAGLSTNPQRIQGTRANGKLGVFLQSIDYDGRKFNVGGVQRPCSDLVVAAVNPGVTDGRVYVYLGKPTFGQRTDELVGTGAEVVYRLGNTADKLGESIGAADVDGDGKGDVIITFAAAADAGKKRFLVDYGDGSVPFMSVSGSPVERLLPASAKIEILGSAQANLGTPIVNLGAIVQASTADAIFIGSSAETNSSGGKGLGYVVRGQARSTTVPEIIDLTTTSSRMFKLEGSATSAIFGIAGAGVGDLDGDGIREFVIGDPFASAQAGEFYVFSLATGTPTSIADAKATFTHGLPDAAGDLFGRSFANGVGLPNGADINGDGIPDIVTSTARTGTTDIGTTFIFFGSGTIANHSTTDATNYALAAPQGGTLAFGRDLLVLGDLNSDGYVDVVVGEFTFGSNVGRILSYY